MANGSDNSIKVPLFFKHTHNTWYGHLEAQFGIKKITASSTKFYWAISALPTDVPNHLTHLIQDPEEDPYQDIKDCLISLYSLSPYQKFKALFNLPLISNMMPSILINSMLNLFP